MFWILYHSSYASLDRFGGGYGNYPSLPVDSLDKEVKEQEAVLQLIRDHAKRLSALNSRSSAAAGGGGSIASARGSGNVATRRRLTAESITGDSSLDTTLDITDDACYWAPPLPKVGSTR
jgi:hypothetical protein